MKGVEEIKSFLETPNRISRFGELPLFDFRTQKEYLGTGGYNEALFITNKGRSPAINSKIRKSPLPDSPQLQALTGNQRRPNRPRTIEIPMLAVDDTRLLFKEGGYFGKKIRITIYFTIETMSPIFVYTYEGETKGLHLVERHFSNKKTSRFERF